MAIGKIRGLGEVALRVSNLDTMQRFYADVMGLHCIQSFPHAVFFKISAGFAGHDQVLALFDRSADPRFVGLNSATTTVDHFAFEIALADFDSEKSRLEQAGQKVETAEHVWVHWRSLYVLDPEGNQVELVCYDPSVT